VSGTYTYAMLPPLSESTFFKLPSTHARFLSAASLAIGTTYTVRFRA
jgi:hypothetical protein